MPKAVVGILFTLILVFLGFLIGAIIGGQNVSPGDGLAGGAIVVGYAAMASLVALVLGIILSIKLDQKPLWILALISLIAVVGIVMYLRHQKSLKDEEKARQEMIEAENRFRSFQVGVSMHDGEIRPAAMSDIQHITTTQRGKRLDVVTTDSGAQCNMALEPDESKAIIRDLYQVIEEKDRGECASADEEIAVQMVWRFYDQDSPGRGNWTLSRACVQNSPAIANLLTTLSGFVSTKCDYGVKQGDQ